MLMQQFERRLAVVERANGVGNQDDVERTGKRSDHLWVLNVPDPELQVRVQLFRLRDHGGAEIEADAEAGLERR